MMMNPNLPTITIATLCRDRDYILPYYLEYIEKINYDKSRINLLWVVNNSTDNSCQILEEFKSKHKHEYNRIKIQIINKSNLIKDMHDKNSRIQAIYEHLANLRNYVCEKSNSDYLFSVDSDILILDPEILNKFISYNKDVISSLIYNGYLFAENPNGKPAPKQYSNALMMTYKHNTPIFEHISRSMIRYFKPEEMLHEVDITGAIYLIKKDVYKNKNVKYLFHQEGEDIPWCILAKKEGYKIYCDFNIYSQHIMSEELLKKFLNGKLTR